MKILYGVQGTGNGHITRARALNRHFIASGAEVDFLFSGRAREKYFDMEEFGPNWQSYGGLTFTYSSGKIKGFSTLMDNKIAEFVRDLRDLDLTPYDLVITDFEPISAWAARLQGKPSVGIGHQYAFHYPVPKSENNLVGRAVMKHFAPVDYGLGLHWHHFNAPILPPIAEVHATDCHPEPDKILVYLGFEEVEDIIHFLEPFHEWLFVIYGPFNSYQCFGNIQLKPLSREGFCRDLATCSGVLSNAGFELASEAIQLGKKLLVKPLGGQMEQVSNARALELLGLGMTMDTLDSVQLSKWLRHFQARQLIYPDVARAIVQWLRAGNWADIPTLATSLWKRVQVAAKPEAGSRKSAGHP